MKKTYMGIFSIFACVLSPLYSSGFSDRELIAEKGIFPPDDPNSPTPPPGQNSESQKEKPLLPPEEPNDATPAPGPNLPPDQEGTPAKQ